MTLNCKIANIGVSYSPTNDITNPLSYLAPPELPFFDPPTELLVQMVRKFLVLAVCRADGRPPHMRHRFRELRDGFLCALEHRR